MATGRLFPNFQFPAPNCQIDLVPDRAAGDVNEFPLFIARRPEIFGREAPARRRGW